MWYIKTLLLSLIICIGGFSNRALALTIGSDSAPSRESFVTFPSGTGNIILGYAAMDGGFALTDYATTLSFNSYFPVNSIMALNDGSLYLLNDLTLASLCDTTTTGTIYGNGYTISWAPRLSTIQLPSTADLPGYLYLNDATVTFNASIQLQSPLYFSGICMLDGQGYTMNLGEDGSINVAQGSSLLIKNIIINGMAGENIKCLDAQAILSLDQVTCQLSADFTFGQGKLEIIDDTLMTGTFTFMYRTSEQSTIHANATWFFDSGMTFSYDPANSAQNLLNFENSQAIFYFYETALYAPSTGLQLTKGIFTVQGNCPVFSDAATEANGIIIGDGITALNDMSLNILPESGLHIMNGYLVNKNLS